MIKLGKKLPIETHPCMVNSFQPTDKISYFVELGHSGNDAFPGSLYFQVMPSLKSCLPFRSVGTTLKCCFSNDGLSTLTEILTQCQ